MRTTRLGRATGNLPVAMTSFVGRRREISEVRKRLAQSRLVTLTGVGGVGKTRLAVEVAADVRRAFDGGVVMVELAAIEDGAQVPQAVINAFELVDGSARAPLDKLLDQLTDCQVLIVLDNCEHLLAACASFVVELLRRSDGVRVLATSRRALGIPGEHLVTVPSLPVPDVRAVPDVAALGEYGAVRLLTDRAAALQPDFAITELNRVAAARVCTQLDGIPLAIELAAARLRTLSLEQLSERLADRFALLTTGSPTATPRQRTLRGLIDWSHSLCTEPERLLWARLSVFVGTFDLEAAECICAGNGLASSAILDLLDRLVADSIVLAEPVADRPRFRLLETIRAYGKERLAELDGLDGLAELRLRHRDYYLRLAQATDAEWCGPGQAACLTRLRAEQGNLQAGLDLSMSDPAGPRAALEFTVALRSHWCVDGFLVDGRRWLDQALELPNQVPKARADALWLAACVSLLQGDAEAGFRRLAECDALAAELGLRMVAARSMSLRGTAELHYGELRAAITLFDRAIAIFQAVGLTEDVLIAMFQLAIALSHLGDSERATTVVREALAISEACGERLSRSYVGWAAGFNEWRHGDSAAAAAWTREGLAIQREFHNPVGVALMIELLAWIAASRDDQASAARLLGAAGSVWDGIGTTIAAFGPAFGIHHQRCEERIRQAFGDSGAAAAVRDGRCATVAQAISTGLAEDPVAVPSAAEQSAADDPSLTAREREVAQLVARGLSNRAIGAALVISPRTVDGHLERILAKLKFNSRTQVAAWVLTHAAAGNG